MITVQALQQVITNDVRGIKKHHISERVDLLSAIGRISAIDIISPLDIPPASVSAMDGYGLWLDSENLVAGSTLHCVGEAIAGKTFTGEVKVGQCIRIMTGAVVPEGVNTIIMQEHTERRATNTLNITLTQSARRGSHIRLRGEEVKQEDTVFNCGQVITENDIPLLASIGYQQISVYPRLRVGVFSTGDELREQGSSLAKGQIYDSNRPTIKALLQSLPVLVNDYGIIKDDLKSIKIILQKVAKENDFVVTSGGVSVGDYDFLKDAVDELGDIVQYKVALKPGKPFVYGLLGQARYFGLPGNPLSTALSARLFLAPAIYHYFTDAPPTLQFQGKLKNNIQRKAGRAELQRGFAEQNAKGEWLVSTSTSQDSHRVYQLSCANVLVFLEAEQAALSEGETVNLLPIHGRFL